MKFVNSTDIFDVEDKYLWYIPFFKGFLSFNELNAGNEIPFIDFDTNDIVNIIDFAMGNDFNMEDESDEDFFSLMGFPNELDYNLDVFKMKLHDNWVRDNMYRLELYRDPYYDLVEVPIVPSMVEAYLGKGWKEDSIWSQLGKTIFIAGGSVLDMIWVQNDESTKDITKEDSYKSAGLRLEFWRNTEFDEVKNTASDGRSGDIDVFFVTDPTTSEGIINSILDDKVIRGNAVSVTRTGIKHESELSRKGLSRKYAADWFPEGFYASDDGHRYGYKIQFILRSYLCPTEIVHGFDVDCTGVLFDGTKAYATRRALFSIKKQTNWFDPSRSSPTYARRLAKYYKRGYKIELPLLDKRNIDDCKVSSDTHRLISVLNLASKMKKSAGNLKIGRGFGDGMWIGVHHFRYINMEYEIRHLYEMTLRLSGLQDIVSKSFILFDEPMILFLARMIIDTFSYINIDDPTFDDENYFNIALVEDTLNEDYRMGASTLTARTKKLMSLTDNQFIGYLINYLRNNFTYRKIVDSSIEPKRMDPVYDYELIDSVKVSECFYNDDASLLLLINKYGIVIPRGSYVSDYEIINGQAISNATFVREGAKVSGLTFIIQDPMTQVTSTFNPMPISDLDMFYASSPYYDRKDCRYPQE